MSKSQNHQSHKNASKLNDCLGQIAINQDSENLITNRSMYTNVINSIVTSQNHKCFMNMKYSSSHLHLCICRWIKYLHLKLDNFYLYDNHETHTTFKS